MRRGPSATRDPACRRPDRLVHERWGAAASVAVGRQPAFLLLEEELNEQLFLRLGRKIRITPAGTTLLGLSQRMFDDLEQTRASILDAQRSVKGTLRLVGGMTVCLYVFPPLLKAFRKDHPAVDVTHAWRDAAADSTAPNGHRGSRPADAAGRRSGARQRSGDAGRAPPRHRAAASARAEEAGHAAGPGAAAVRPLRVGSGTRNAIEEFFVREHISPSVVTETENVEIIKALVRINMGVTIIPYQAVAREVRSGHLFCARIAGQQLVRETGWVHLRLNRVPRSVQEMMNTFERIRGGLKLCSASRPAARSQKRPPFSRRAGCLVPGAWVLGVRACMVAGCDVQWCEGAMSHAARRTSHPALGTLALRTFALRARGTRHYAPGTIYFTSR